MRRLLCSLLWCLLWLPVPLWATEEEFIGPLSTWTNLKTVYGAVGDGIEDDTAALQLAFTELGTSGHASVLYIPAGTYKVTENLTIETKIYVAIIGEDPATTIIAQHGTKNTVLYINGMAYSKISRLTIDGRGNTVVAIWQGRDGLVPYFDTGNEYTDIRMLNTTYGLYGGGGTGSGFAETTLKRATFTGITTCVIVGNQNALDLWIWDSLFDGCTTGVTNNPGAGSFRVYNSVFHNSTTADIAIANTESFSIRGNYSSGSAKFFTTTSQGNPATITLQGNTVVNGTSTAMVTLGNHGPILLMDNVFRSGSGVTTGPVVTMAHSNSDLITVGNTFTVSTPITANGRWLALDDTSVTYASLSGLTEPALPSTPASQRRTIVEVTNGSNTATIQSAINTAVAGAPGSVVHIQPGTYSITSPLTLPANATVQLVGDTFGVSTLAWSGGNAGPVLSITGPSTARIKDLGFSGNSLRDGIVASTIDQVGARVFLQGVQLRSASGSELLVQAMDHAAVDLRDAGLLSATGVALTVDGGAAQTTIHSGLTSSQPLTVAVRNGGKLLVRDTWYETPLAQPAYMDLSNSTGTVTFDGGRIATPAGATPAVLVSSWQGLATFLTTKMSDRVTATGSGTGMQVLGLGMLGPLPSAVDPWFVDSTSPAGDVRLLSSRRADATLASISQTNIGAAEATWLRTMLAQARAATAAPIADLGAGVTDLRLYRVNVSFAVNGITLLGGGGDPTETPIVLRLVR